MVHGEAHERDKLNFPDFLWILRDMDTISALSPTDYVRQILKKNKSCGVLNLFPSFHCISIPPPSSDTSILSDITSNLGKLSVHFNRGVTGAIEHVLDTIRVKVGYDSSVKCDGSMLACLIEQHFTLINKPEAEIPTFQASWLMAIELKMRRISESLVNDYDRDMRRELKARPPLNDGMDGETGETLMNLHLQVFAKKRLEFQKAFLSQSHAISEKMSNNLIAYFDKSVAEFDQNTKVIDGRLFHFIEENEKFSQDFCTLLYSEKYKVVSTKLQNALSHQMPTFINQELIDFRNTYFKEALGPAVYSVYKQMREVSAKLESHLKLIPGPVEELEVVGVDADRVKVKWTAPEFNSSAVEEYDVLIKSKAKDWQLVSSRNGFSALVVGLQSSTWYCISVRAKSKLYCGNKVQFVRVRTLLSKRLQQTVHASAVLASPVVYPCMVAYAASGLISKGVLSKSPLDVCAGGFMLTLLPATVVIGMIPIAGALASSDQYKKEVSDRLGDLSEEDTEVLRWQGVAYSLPSDGEVDVPDDTDTGEIEFATHLQDLEDENV